VLQEEEEGENKKKKKKKKKKMVAAAAAVVVVMMMMMMVHLLNFIGTHSSFGLNVPEISPRDITDLRLEGNV
jgi:flagellar basal body-associated protein FliL